MRTYQKTHPWIKFEPVDLRSAPTALWILLGEARSKCDHLGSIALDPELAKVLHLVYLAKGAAATTAIEGNTLSEEEVMQRVQGELELPLSQEYLGVEVDNIVTATNAIWDRVRISGFEEAQAFSLEEICKYNRLVLKETQYADYVIPGRIRETVTVTAGNYRGAPPEDCRYLVEMYCQWLNEWRVNDGPETGVIMAIIKAVVAHVMFEWIHPFGDGNGRVGRLLEFKILVAGGVPTVAAHLLSNHYNATRARYYLELARASKSREGMLGFLKYAVEGFVDQLVQQIDIVLAKQLIIVWTHLIHRRFQNQKSVTAKRQRDLALALSSAYREVPFKEIPTLDRDLALQYAKVTDRTLLRDLGALKRMNLVRQSKAGYAANREIIMSNLSSRRTEVENRYLQQREVTMLDRLMKKARILGAGQPVPGETK